MRNDSGRNSKIAWEAKSEKEEVEYYCLAKGLSVSSFLRFAGFQYMGRFKLRASEIARADKIMAERGKVKPRGAPVQANEV